MSYLAILAIYIAVAAEFSSQLLQLIDVLDKHFISVRIKLFVAARKLIIIKSEITPFSERGKLDNSMSTYNLEAFSIAKQTCFGWFNVKNWRSLRFDKLTLDSRERTMCFVSSRRHSNGMLSYFKISSVMLWAIWLSQISS